MSEVKMTTEARRSLKDGVDITADLAGLTMGPMGGNILIGGANRKVTNDGDSISKIVNSNDVFENEGVELLKQVGQEMVDGNTTYLVIAQELVSNGIRYVEAGADKMSLREGMNLAKDHCVKALKEASRPVKTVKELVYVATVSMEDPVIGKMVGEAVFRVGKDGAVTVEKSNTPGVSVEIVEGFSLNKGTVSATDESVFEMQDVSVLLTEEKITSISQLEGILDILKNKEQTNVLLVADDIDEDTLSILAWNKMQGLIDVVVVRTPEYGERKKQILSDISTISGATVFSKENPIKEAKTTGKLKRVISSKEKTTLFFEGRKSHIEKQSNIILENLKKSEGNYEEEFLKERLGRLNSGVAVVKVGAAVESELNYLKDKLDDAIAASKLALEEGIIMGGGMALLNVQRHAEEPTLSEDVLLGYRTVMKALSRPFEQIVENTHRDEVGSLKVLIKGKNSGYNAKTGKIENDMFKAGIVDSLKVTRLALMNAVSFASTLLTIDAIYIPDEVV